MNPALTYRRDIDGLRAIAVLPVVLFHLGITTVSGGFVGVDVFFVISGFLITSIVYREALAGEFSYARFYERRIRRLFPALAVMLFVSAVIAWFLLLPEDYKLFSEAQGLAVLFLANIHFWNKTDYFNDAVQNIPLLHTWSLSVEEQFYLLFPPLLLLLLRYVPTRASWVLLAFVFLSFFGAQRELSDSPETAFYLVHLRAWELLAGALLAMGALPVHRWQWLRELSAVAGMLLILGSIFYLDKDSAFPGVGALPAVLGAVLVIHAGHLGNTFIGRLLSLRWLVFFGLISYSLYLWHWPLFVFYGYYKIIPFGAVEQGGLLVFAVLLGWLSWRFVETPFRRKSDPAKRKQFFRKAGLVAAGIIVIALPGAITKGAAFRLPEQIVEMASVVDETIPFRRPCFGLSVEDVEQERNICTLGREGEAEFLLWGDSHALSLAHGIDLAAKNSSFSGRFLARSVCPPVLGSRQFKPSDVDCSEFNDAVVRYLDRHQEIRHVILVGVWSHYIRHGDDRDEVGFAHGFDRTLEAMSARGIAVTVIQQVPKINYDVPSAAAKFLLFERHIEIRPALSEHRRQVGASIEFFESRSRLYDFVQIDLDKVFCGDEYCEVMYRNMPLYRDSHHLSRHGSEQAVGTLQKIFLSYQAFNHDS